MEQSQHSSRENPTDLSFCKEKRSTVIRMDNENDWNWDDGDERIVSSVYREEDETNAFILINPPQNTKSQKKEIKDTEPQNNIPQPEFHPIVLPQSTRQNYSDQGQNTNRSAKFSEKDISENKVSAIAAYLLGPIGIIIALLIARDSAYTAFHVREALKITICSVLLELFAAVFVFFGMIPLVGIIFRIMLVIACAAWLSVFVLRLIAIVQVSNGEAKEPAIIDSFLLFK